MADIMGVLGSNTVVTVGTQTVYTVPTGKSAKVKLMYVGVIPNTCAFTINVNGIAIMTDTSSGAENIFSSPNAVYENTGAAVATGVDGDTTVAPAPVEYFLTAGDTVTYTIGTVDATSLNFQVVGVEIDAS